MEAPPADPKRISWFTLLFPLLSVALAIGLTVWQKYATQPPTVPAELTAAHNALKANNVEQARQQFEKALVKAPDAPLLYRAIMSECAEAGRWDLARECGERAIQACRYAPNPDRAELYEVLASCYADGGEPVPQPRAMEYTRRAVELVPDDPNALNDLGYRMTENAHTEQEANIALGTVNYALNLLRGQASASPDLLAQTEDSYGWALYKRGKFHAEDYAHAADALRQAVEDIPDGMAAAAQKVMYYHLGAACRAAGQTEEARHALQIALMYDPNYAEAKAEMNLLPPPPIMSTQPAPSTPVTAPASAPLPVQKMPAVPTHTPDGKPIFKPLPDNKPTK